MTEHVEGNMITTPMYEIHIIQGLDEDGDEVYVTKFAQADREGQLIPFVTGLGMLEAAKQDFIERWNTPCTCDDGDDNE